MLKHEEQSAQSMA